MLIASVVLLLVTDVAEPRVFPRPSPIVCGSSRSGAFFVDGRFTAPPGGLFWVNVKEGEDGDGGDPRDLVFAPSGETAVVDIVFEATDDALADPRFRTVSLGVRVPEGAAVNDRFAIVRRLAFESCEACDYELDRTVVEAGPAPSLVDIALSPGEVECSGSCREPLTISSANVSVRTSGGDAMLEAITAGGLRTGILFVPANADVVLSVRTVADPDLNSVDIVLRNADSGEEIERRTLAADVFFPVPEGGACVDCGCSTTTVGPPGLALSIAAVALAWLLRRHAKGDRGSRRRAAPLWYPPKAR